MMQASVHNFGPLVLFFFLGNTIAGTENTLTASVMDLHAHWLATANAGIVFFRSLTGAGVAAAVVPLNKAIGIG